jgi:AcrR family transcriptional regulator
MFGYQQVSMADIGQASSLARSSLYEYFSSKEEIALGLLSNLAVPFEAIKIHGKKLEKRVTNLLEDTLQAANANANLLSLYFGSFAGLDQAGRNQASEWQRAILNTFFEIYKDEKKLRLSASKAAYFSLGLVLQRIQDTVFSKSSLNPEEEAGLMAAFILKGLD